MVGMLVAVLLILEIPVGTNKNFPGISASSGVSSEESSIHSSVEDNRQGTTKRQSVRFSKGTEIAMKQNKQENKHNLSMVNLLTRVWSKNIKETVRIQGKPFPKNY